MPLQPVVFAVWFSNEPVPYRTLNMAFLEHALIADSLKSHVLIADSLKLQILSHEHDFLLMLRYCCS